MSKIYLTIDDSPSKNTRALVDFMYERGVQALLFCRGDFLETNKDSIIYAIQHGMVIGNHLYSHVRSSRLGGLEKIKDEILRSEEIIENIYMHAGHERPGKYIRFPYIDRGDGTEVERIFAKIIENNANGKPVFLGQSENVKKIQMFLGKQGFEQPFSQINHPLYEVEDIAGAYDSLFTYSTGDWMLNQRHLVDKYEGGFPYKNIGDLKNAIDKDPYLNDGSLSHIVLLHDHPETLDVAKALIDYFLQKEFIFQPIVDHEQKLDYDHEVNFNHPRA